MKKRIVSTVLAAAMAASMLAGCGSSAKETVAAAGKQEQSGDAVAEKDKAESADPADADASGKKLKVVYLCNGNLGDKGFNDSAASGMQMRLTRWELRSRPLRWAGMRPAMRATTWMCPSRIGT